MEGDRFGRSADDLTRRREKVASSRQDVQRRATIRAFSCPRVISLLVGGRARRGKMRTSRSSRYGRAHAAAVLAFCGLVAACSPVPGEPAPVYMMGTRPTAYQSMASAPIQQAMA